MSVNESTDSKTTVDSFAERAAAFARSKGYAPFEFADLSGTPMRIREELVGWHGPVDEESGTGDWVYPGRTVIDVPGRDWQASRPEDCPNESAAGIWLDAAGDEVPAVGDAANTGGIVLLCPQCGLDCT
ncbi:hypothetical protein Lesp02_03060 [Lentzea sp. NBRC 105346]|uniref:hypothetical protein n=1 Tax=Lentzea sp. NBRC 105346 TaxID=3032205 RepID=UPI0024A04EF1|nr:hypothetical protein [Lentzea sp. NBRC 105346]GLZ28116.1 hypothetical protein Lesp02_03060 [Lentzea sp. NBRC 105346]